MKSGSVIKLVLSAVQSDGADFLWLDFINSGMALFCSKCRTTKSEWARVADLCGNLPGLDELVNTLENSILLYAYAQLDHAWPVFHCYLYRCGCRGLADFSILEVSCPQSFL